MFKRTKIRQGIYDNQGLKQRVSYLFWRDAATNQDISVFTGTFFCGNCYKKVTESTKTCPFCKRDVASNPITNRALDKVTETEARTEVGAGSQN